MSPLAVAVKEESRADHRGQAGLCGLSAISELKRTIILTTLPAQASASVSRNMFIHPNWFPFRQFSVICWTVSFAFAPADFLERSMWQLECWFFKQGKWILSACISHIALHRLYVWHSNSQVMSGVMLQTPSSHGTKICVFHCRAHDLNYLENIIQEAPASNVLCKTVSVLLPELPCYFPTVSTRELNVGDVTGLM